MTVFRDALAAFGVDGLYTPADDEHVPGRIIARRPDTIVGFGETDSSIKPCPFRSRVRATTCARTRSSSPNTSTPSPSTPSLPGQTPR
jgi:hypothetical protein